MSAIDDNVGRVMQALEDLGLTENTIVVYFSDHGDTFRYRVQGTLKFVCHDEAIKVPLPSPRTDQRTWPVLQSRHVSRFWSKPYRQLFQSTQLLK